MSANKASSSDHVPRRTPRRAHLAAPRLVSHHNTDNPPHLTTSTTNPLPRPTTLGALISQFQAFRTPSYDDCDKCDFCEHVKTRFSLAVDVVKKMHKDRLWGLCLDCFKAGGVKEGECRYEHSKPKAK